MAGNRFFKCEIWTQNRWFRELKPTSKLFWFYLVGTCDNVGVWEEDWALASFVMGTPLDPETLLKDMGDRVQRIAPTKLWITDFCDFQYGQLNDETTDKPRLSYIKLLKKHGLWQTLYKPLGNPLESPKDKDKEKTTDKEPEREKDNDQENDDFEFEPEDEFVYCEEDEPNF